MLFSETDMNQDEGHQQELEGRRELDEYEQFMRDCQQGRNWFYFIDQDTGYIIKVENHAN